MMCSGAVWEMSGGQEVTKVGFMPANITTPTRSEIALCIYHHHHHHHLSASHSSNNMTEIQLAFIHPQQTALPSASGNHHVKECTTALLLLLIHSNIQQKKIIVTTTSVIN